jgi:hypothetical protein
LKDLSTCIKVVDTIALVLVLAKYNYNTKRKLVFFEVDNNIYFTLYKGYSILSAKNKKLGQQYTGLFCIIEKVGYLVYKLDLPAY